MAYVSPNSWATILDEGRGQALFRASLSSLGPADVSAVGIVPDGIGQEKPTILH